MRGYTASEDDGLSIQNLDGSIKIALQSGKVVVTGASEFNGDIQVNGAISSTGDIERIRIIDEIVENYNSSKV